MPIFILKILIQAVPTEPMVFALKVLAYNFGSLLLIFVKKPFILRSGAVQLSKDIQCYKGNPN